VFAAWRQRRLRALEAAVLARAGAPAEDEGPPSSLLPSLPTLVRYRARLDRHWRRATEELELLRRSRSAQPSPAQLRLVADLIERGQAAATDGAAEEKRTNENRVGTNEPDASVTTDGLAPGDGTDEPTATTNRTNESVCGTDELRYLVPPLPETCTNEAIPAALQPPSRHQRCRLAALARRGLRRAA
jgi:hypothetical protein